MPYSQHSAYVKGYWYILTHYIQRELQTLQSSSSSLWERRAEKGSPLAPDQSFPQTTSATGRPCLTPSISEGKPETMDFAQKGGYMLGAPEGPGCSLGGQTVAGGQGAGRVAGHPSGWLPSFIAFRYHFLLTFTLRNSYSSLRFC